MNPKDLVASYWAAMNTNDFAKAAEFFTEDFQCRWPLSREIVRGKENLIRINTEYPAQGQWCFVVHRLVAEGENVVTDVTVSDGSMTARAITFHRIRGGLIAEQVEYWPDPYDAPEWRRPWVEQEAWTIEKDSPDRPDTEDLLRSHLEGMHANTPAGSIHALDLGAYRTPGITLWSAREGDALLGCGALKELTPEHGEIKSMKTAPSHTRKGVARGILAFLIEEAGRRGYARLSLETGSSAAFEPARNLYSRSGFVLCGPFGEYKEDPHSVFMTKSL